MCAGRWSLLSAFCCLPGVLIANLYNLQIVRFNDYQTRSNENRIKLVPIPPSRGIIYDRNGTPLALNRTIYQIEMMPEKVDNVQETLEALRPVVDLTDDDIANFKKERARSHRFTSIAVKTNLTEVQVARFAVNQYRVPRCGSERLQTAASILMAPR
ncbi:penicillin-binding protein 2 [Cedecea neteri]|uniref:Penicillin-binding protein 2 n=1 Tax=Cedecea neteri TaxID=158822 RepID=A0A2X2T8F3_9ENTR|nr:penicillin-binding protein 2 [Cedecea neteri]